MVYPVKIEKFHRVVDYKKRHSKKKKDFELKYNIEIEENNNYFANGILVHNCLWGGDPGFSWAKVRWEQIKKLRDKKE